MSGRRNQLGCETGGQLEVELRIPIVGRGFDRASELFFRAAQPTKASVVVLLDPRFVEERAPRPEMRPRPFGRALGLVDRLVISFEPVQEPQLVRHDPVVLVRKRLLHRRQAIEPRLADRVAGERLRVIARIERRVAVGDRPHPARERDGGAAQHQEDDHQCRP